VIRLRRTAYDGDPELLLFTVVIIIYFSVAKSLAVFCLTVLHVFCLRVDRV